MSPSLPESGKEARVDIRYNARGMDLLFDRNRIEGVRVRDNGEVRELSAKSVVLACGRI